MEDKKIKIFRYIYSAIVLILFILSVVFLREVIGVYLSIIIGATLVYSEYILNALLDNKFVFNESMKEYNNKIFIIKIVFTTLVLIVLYVFNLNFVLQIIGYVIAGLWFIFLSGQEKLVKFRNDKFQAERNKLNKKNKITNYKKK